MASSGLTRKEMSQMFKKIGWRRKEDAPPPQATVRRPRTGLYVCRGYWEAKSLSVVPVDCREEWEWSRERERERDERKRKLCIHVHVGGGVEVREERYM